MDLRFYVPLRNIGFLLKGALLTLELVSISCVLGVVIGVFGVLAQKSPWRPLRYLTNAYVEIIRNTPLLVQVYFAYFALPSLKINMTPSQAGLLILTINAGAYMTEIIRAGIESIHQSQVEAGYSLGMNYLQVFRHVILPPAMRAIALPLGNQFISMTLSSAVISQISADELTFRAMRLESITFRSFEIYFTIFVMYFIVAELLFLALDYLNKRLFRHAPKAALPRVL